jgi:propanol-preferring alcohol dehydrogenase
MKAMVIEKPAPIESDPLHAFDVPIPEPGRGEILARIRTCGVCRTDLHVAEGDLPPRHPRIIPGHEIVGVVEKRGVGAARFKQGDRVGIAWLRETCGVCVYCRRGRENLCLNARFTGYDHDGGYCEYAVVREDFAYALPDLLGDEEAAPLLCAGIIGFRVFVMSRGGPHRDLAKDLGAEWIGNADDAPPAPLDAAILFAPAGNLVLPAMQALDRGGILAVAGIYLSPIPVLDYEKHLFYEKELRSVTANTRADGEEFLKLAAEIPIRISTMAFGLAEANVALKMLKHDEIKGAGVLRIS